MTGGFSMLFRPLHELRRGLSRFRRLDGRTVLHDLLRARRMKSAVMEAVPAPQRRERIVISLTTIPERIERLRPVLNSLIDQTEPAGRIILALPETSRRSGKPYPLPEHLPGGVELLRCTDEGPATKLLPALKAEPDALVIAADDDVIYPRNFVESLLQAHRKMPEAALGLRGVRLQDDRKMKDLDHVFGTAVQRSEAVDILFGTWGYCIPPGALDQGVHDFSGYPPVVRNVDDVWISGHLAKRGVSRYVVPIRGLPIETRSSRHSALTHTLNRSGENDATAIAAFQRWW